MIKSLMNTSGILERQNEFSGILERQNKLTDIKMLRKVSVLPT
jgi:hypothetical protein